MKTNPSMQALYFKKYLGFHMDIRFTWEEHITKKNKTNQLKNEIPFLANTEKVRIIFRQ